MLFVLQFIHMQPHMLSVLLFASLSSIDMGTTSAVFGVQKDQRELLPEAIKLVRLAPAAHLVSLCCGHVIQSYCSRSDPVSARQQSMHQQDG